MHNLCYGGIRLERQTIFHFAEGYAIKLPSAVSYKDLVKLAECGEIRVKHACPSDKVCLFNTENHWHAQLWLYSFPSVETSTAQLWFHIWSVCLWSGVNVFLRKIAVAAASSPAVEITQQEETLSIKTSTSVRTTNVSFTVGQSFSETTVDGRPCTVHVSLLQLNQKTV